jgi:hypothetical protein
LTNRYARAFDFVAELVGRFAAGAQGQDPVLAMKIRGEA